MAGTFQDVGDFDIAVALGVVKNTNGNPYQSFEKFGHNPTMGTAPEALRSFGGSFTWLQAASAFRIAPGGNAADAAGGIGAQTIQITGLDKNGLLASETLKTNGVAASTVTVGTYIRIFDAKVIECGIYGAGNIGTIQIQDSNLDIHLEIDRLENVAHSMTFSTPVDHTAFLEGAVLQVESGKDVDFLVFARPGLMNVTDPFTPPLLLRQFSAVPQGIHSLPFTNPRVLPPGSDFFILANSVQAAAAGGGLIEYKLVPNK